MADEMTLDPPGSIAVIGAGPLGIEAALYGRFLGYDVTILEANQVAHSLLSHRDEALPLSPDRCLSPLAVAALQSQNPQFATSMRPMTIGQWVDDVLVPLTETDLLAGRLRCPAKVSRIHPIDVEPDDGSDDDEIPPDFRLTLDGVASNEVIDAESVIAAIGDKHSIELGFQPPQPYFFRIGPATSSDSEAAFWAGLREIVSVYAKLAGREDLDLYRPRRR
jgi:hypothetical protein